ncbi:MAG: SDR family oxidoreductase [Hyphomicrobiales bacterium]|nr:SDR family oxidoreductase [Hyphomicrobiales bacterium]
MTDKNSKELAGEVAIVTGAATNTGATIAKTLARAGAAVVVNYRSSKDLAHQTVNEIERAGGRAIAVQGDVCNQADVQRLVDETVRVFGPPSILVNNANVRSFASLMEITPKLWRDTLGPTLDGTLYCVQACVPHMQARGGGAIVNIGGGSGHSGVPNRAHVAAAKAGLAGLTGALAAELAPYNISVNNIVPGRIETPRPGGEGPMPGLHASPMGRSCRQDEVAELVRFLAGLGCRYMSGQMLHVNGARYVTIA